MADPKRLLILGGTGEAAALAHRLALWPDLHMTTSLAGRTRAPAAVPGAARSGGFGGVAGLRDYLRDHRIDFLVDATHPYAARMTANATQACGDLGVPRLVLTRPPWQPQRRDRWIQVGDAKAAASVLSDLGRRVFLSIGRQELAPFAGLPGIWFLVRLIDAPEDPLPLASYELILGRGPFAAEDEAATMQDHGIAVVVSKNSGGQAAHGKIEAARGLGLPVVMLDRPPLPEGQVIYSVDKAVAWVETQCSRHQGSPHPSPPPSTGEGGG